jgi:hypothetical protein
MVTATLTEGDGQRAIVRSDRERTAGLTAGLTRVFRLYGDLDVGCIIARGFLAQAQMNNR